MDGDSGSSEQTKRGFELELRMKMRVRFEFGGDESERLDWGGGGGELIWGVFNTQI